MENDRKNRLASFILDCCKDKHSEYRSPVLHADDCLPLLETDDLRQILGTPGLQPPKVRLVKQRNNDDPRTLGIGQDGTVGLVNNFEHIKTKVGEGHTLVVDHVNSVSRKCGAICDVFSQVLGAPHHANLYWSEMPVPGFGPHEDSHDLFAFQVLGSKTWKFPSSEGIHLWGTGGKTAKAELLLTGGDILFVKSGVEHDVLSTDGISVHLTISKGENKAEEGNEKNYHNSN